MLKESKKCVYPVSEKWKYKNTNIPNTFIFENNIQCITLYYQPVIYDSDRRKINGLGLYRNNTVSLNYDTDCERKGRYYVPDFVIKTEKDGASKYIICDAKFSALSTIKNYYLSNLTFKYLFSISTSDKNDVIAGLCIIYGQCTADEQMKTIYDKQLNGQNIFPFAETLPIIECNDINQQFKSIIKLIR